MSGSVSYPTASYPRVADLDAQIESVLRESIFV
jgi:hypothetical protein